MYYKTRGYKIFYAFNMIFIGVLAILCLLPFVHLMAVSFSSASAATGKLVTFWPIDFTLDSYKLTLGNDNFVNSIWITVQRTVWGTLLSIFTLSLAAYPLSKSDRVLKGRTLISWFYVFTMLFSAGFIPLYLVVLKLGMLNTMWALILPKMVIVFNLVLLLNFFRAIPEDFDEAALMDGAGYYRILFQIYIPLSMPALATLSLFTMVWHWNSWFDGLIYISDYTKYPLSTFLQNIVIQLDYSQLNMDEEEIRNLSQRALNASQIMLGTLPILLVYPFLQRYFVKGIQLGGVKE